MGNKTNILAPFGPITINSQGWFTPLGGIDATGAANVVGVSTAVAASNTLTFAGNASDGDTFTLGGQAYRVKSTMAQAYDVKLGASAAATLDNIKAAVNQSGTAGTEYYTGTLKHPTIEATTNTDTTQLFVAKNAGVLGNLLGATETFTDAGNVFSSATFTGGLDSALNVSLGAGGESIGSVDVNSAGYQSTITFTRTADTTPYTGLDVIGINNAGSAGSAIHTLANAGPAGGVVVILDVKLCVNLTGVPSGMTSFRLWLFHTSPTAIADNAAFTLDASDRSDFVGVVDIPTVTDVGGFLHAKAVGVNQTVKLASGSTSLYGILQTTGGFTPTSGEEYSIEVTTAAI